MPVVKPALRHARRKTGVQGLTGRLGVLRLGVRDREVAGGGVPAGGGSVMVGSVGTTSVGFVVPVVLALVGMLKLGFKTMESLLV